MLIAKQNNQLIDLRKIKNIDFSQLKSASDYTCPYCGAAVIFKHEENEEPIFLIGHHASLIIIMKVRLITQVKSY